MADWDVVSQTPMQQDQPQADDWTPVSHEPMTEARSDDWTTVSHEPISEENNAESQGAPKDRTFLEKVGRDVRVGARSIIPTTVGILGGLGAAGLAAETGPGALVAGVVGGGIAGAAAQKAQNAASDWLGIDSEAQRQEDARNPDIGTYAAEFAPAAIPLGGASNLATKLSQRLLTGGIQGAVDLGQQAVTKGSDIDPYEVAGAAATGALLPNVRGWAGRATGFPMAPQGAGVEASSAPTMAPKVPETGVAGSGGAANAPPATMGRVDGNEAASPPVSPADQGPSPQTTPSVAGTAYDHTPTLGAKGEPAGGSHGDNNPVPGQFGAVGSKRDYGAGLPAAQEGGVPGAEAVPVREFKDTDPDLLSTLQGQQEVEPNAQINPAPPPQPEPPPQAPEQGAPAPVQAPQAPGPPQGEALIPPALRREPGNPVYQQLEPVTQAMARQKMPKNLAEATQAIEDEIGKRAPQQPAAAQEAIDAADQKLGRTPLRTRNAIENWTQKIFGPIVNPPGMGENANALKGSIRENLGEINDRFARINHALTQNMRDVVGAMSPEQQHEIQRALQDPNPMERLSKTPEAEPLVRMLRGIIKSDALYKQSKGYLDPEQIEANHFPQMWKDPKKAEDFFDNWMARQGSTSGFKAKKFPTIADGEAAGLQLKYDNPIDAVVARMKGDYRYMMADTITKQGLQEGVIKTEPGPGLVPLEARARKGQQLYAPEDYATVFNNHFGPGFRDSAAGRAFMDVAQPATAWSRSLLLGLSPFHGITMMNEAFISQLKLGMHQIANGNPASGLKTMAMSPIGFKTLYDVGRAGQKAAIAKPGSDMGDFAQTIPALKQANAQLFGNQAHSLEFNPGEGANKPLPPAPAESIMQAFSNGLKEAKSNITTNFRDAKGNPIELGKATLKAVGEGMQALSHPLFGQIIPAMKVGAMHMELGEWMRANPEAAADPAKVHDIAMRIADDVDNRFGLMMHDNLFINNKIKEGMQVGMTSPTWTIGFLRNFAGGLARGAMHPSRISMKSKDYDPNISSAITLGIAVALTSGIYQYLKTGKPPGSVYDLMAGQTGGHTKQGQPERAILPGFQKDVYGWFNDPVNEAYNKLGPLPKAIIDTARNQGWFNTPKGPRYGMISNPNDPVWKQVADRASHFAQAFVPISVQQFNKYHAPGSNISTGERAAAIREAPKWINPGGNRGEKEFLGKEYKKSHGYSKGGEVLRRDDPEPEDSFRKEPIPGPRGGGMRLRPGPETSEDNRFEPPGIGGAPSVNIQQTDPDKVPQYDQGGMVADIDLGQMSDYGNDPRSGRPLGQGDIGDYGRIADKVRRGKGTRGHPIGQTELQDSPPQFAEGGSVLDQGDPDNPADPGPRTDENINAYRKMSQMGQNANIAKFESEARPSENIEDVRSKAANVEPQRDKTPWPGNAAGQTKAAREGAPAPYRFPKGRSEGATTGPTPGMAEARAAGYKKGGVVKQNQMTVIRHGSTKLNSDDGSMDRLRGWKDEPLDERGIADAHKAADEVAKMNPKPKYLATSDLKRAHDTAKIISAKTGIPIVEVTQALRPWDMGKFTGTKTSEALGHLNHYINKHPNVPLPSGNGQKGEAFNHFLQRALGGIKQIRQKHGPDGALVTHHRVERTLSGLRPDGTVDTKIFDKKGEGTGSVQQMNMP